MASQTTITIIFLLLVAQVKAPLPFIIGPIASAAAAAISAGTSLAGTTIQALTSLPYKVTMGMEVENWTKFELLKPKVTLKSGALTTPPVPVRPGLKEAMVTRKTSDAATGTFGVVSWEKADKSRRVVVMWSVPYDYTYYSNWLAVGITKKDAHHDVKWADQMYYYGPTAILGFERQEYYYNPDTVEWEDSGLGLIVYATMSTTQHALVKVIFSAKNASDLAKIRDNLAKDQKEKASPALPTVEPDERPVGVCHSLWIRYDFYNYLKITARLYTKITAWLYFKLTARFYF